MNLTFRRRAASSAAPPPSSTRPPTAQAAEVPVNGSVALAVLAAASFAAGVVNTPAALPFGAGGAFSASLPWVPLGAGGSASRMPADQASAPAV